MIETAKIRRSLLKSPFQAAFSAAAPWAFAPVSPMALAALAASLP
jgi:hypothetical protein